MASMAVVEANRVASVELVDCAGEVLKRAEHVVVRRHEAELMTLEQSVRDELGQDADCGDVIARVSEDVLLGDRAGREVVHRSRLPAAGGER